MLNREIIDIIKYIKNKKISFIKIIDIRKISSLVDYFIIFSMDNIRSVKSVTDELIDYLYKINVNIKKIEGINSPWIVIDCYDYMIHIFNEEERKYYNLEKNWIDGNIVNIEDL